ncbi:MAG TPA: class I fructose-bisphosphate aldolase [Rariglobus sp.]
MSSGPALETTARALVAPGKGILAADESLTTIGKRFAALNIPSTQETRRAYRELLFTAPGLGEFISGVILFDETLRQTSAGMPMPAVLARQGIMPGVKVDLGTAAFPGFPGEKFTQGFDGLRERLSEYRRLGARFTKWRAVIAIGDGLPTTPCIETNARDLARFAALSQEAGLVPIVEPEVLMDGAHTIARCEAVTGAVLKAVFTALDDHRVTLGCMLLKTGMVLPGKDHAQPAGLDAVAAATLRALAHAVPPAVPGVVFLSGGQTDLAATARLNAICAAGPAPWTLSFSFGRALQDEAMKTWGGSPSNKASAQAALRHRARCNGFAVQGRYLPAMEHASPA